MKEPPDSSREVPDGQSEGNVVTYDVLMGRSFGPGCWVEQLNCCVNRIYMEPQRVRILSINETAHLTVRDFVVAAANMPR